MKKWLFWIVVILSLAGYGYYKFDSRPTTTSNICEIFDQRPHWFVAALHSEKKWGVSIPTTMSFIKQESSFDQYAKPRFKYVLWVIPWGRLSSSYGFSQAVNGTWEMYVRDIKTDDVSRTSFYDSADFVGWFVTTASNKNNFAKNDARTAYLNYHEGWNGYSKGTHNSKPSLLKVATKVETNAKKYENQLAQCRDDLESSILTTLISFIW